MRRAVATLAVVAGMVGIAAGPAAAVEPIPDGNVGLAGCVFVYGTADVPTGQPITLRFGWGDESQGLVRSFIAKLDLDVTVDGVPVAHTQSRWSRPTELEPGVWVSFWTYQPGALAEGQTMVVGIQATLRAAEAGFPKGSQFFDPGATCTIV